jgi:amino acid adenylation domain-containing protein
MVHLERLASENVHGSDRLVHQIVEDVARRRPNAIAVSFAGTSVSYRQLIERVDVVAAGLSQLGMSPGATIGILLNRSIDAVVAVLAVLKSGGAYVPLDPDYPEDRLRFVAADARMRAAVTSKAFAPLLARIGLDAIDVEQHPSGAAATAPATTPGCDDLAYVIYTSGSAGKPKGVMVTHGNLAHSTAARFEYYRVPVTAYLLLSPFVFDSSVAGLFWTLCSGGRLILPPPGAERDPARLAGLIEQERASHLLALPSLYRLILGQAARASLSSLRTVIVAGEACPVALAADHRRVSPGVAFFNEYGPTEATVWCTVQEVSEEPIGTRVPIGCPIPRMRCHIVGADGALVSPGEPGELYVGGAGVAAGYLNRPDLTAERFVPDRFGDSPGGRLYRTGDLGRLLPDGTIDFLGRVDHQVKIRGCRIELGEVEAALSQHPGVRDAVVIARAQASGDLRLIAYVVPRADTAPNASDLRTFLAAQLPDFMQPAVYVTLDEFPLTATGKIDREALPGPGRERPSLQQACVAPRTPLERWLCRSWAEILELDEVGLHDPFADLGGSSIQAARFINGLQDVLNEFVFIVLIFECPTVARLAARLRRDYAPAVARVFGEAAPAAEPALASDERVDDTMIRRARCSVGTRARTARASGPRNPPAVFILSPPRSGTTLLTAMLAGHPRLFAASELNLLGFDTLGQRRSVFEGTSSVFLDGAIRTLMEIHGVTAEDAIARMNLAEVNDLGVREFYGALQRAIAPRLLLDKSPAYGLDPTTLLRAEEDFERPLYVHLSRHPFAMVRSFADHHMEQVYFPHEGFTARQAGELVWLMTHRNVLDFLRDVPADRQAHVRYEDLVTQPDRTMRAVCAALDLEFAGELLEPYLNKDRKIPPGVRPDSKPLGDPKFHAYGRITAERADIQADDVNGASWGSATIALASELGYDVHPRDPRTRPDHAPGTADAARAGQIRDRLEQRRRRRHSRIASAVRSSTP